MWHAWHAWESRPITQGKPVPFNKSQEVLLSWYGLWPRKECGATCSLYTGQNLRIRTCSSEFWGISLKNLWAAFYFVLPLRMTDQSVSSLWWLWVTQLNMYLNFRVFTKLWENKKDFSPLQLLRGLWVNPGLLLATSFSELTGMIF